MADARRQLRSTTVALGGMGLLAAALTACSSDPDKRCVDPGSYTLSNGYRVVSDKNCSSSGAKSTGSWYYGGSKKNGFVSGGSFVRPGKGGSGGSSRVDRGGFGGGKSGSGG
ncbi:MULTISPECIES: hypothetical protein [unclassified Streptomyces]|uniref:hypothetical protein n=1 Tax=unclassified Streptomyces TaxID=2593676 RepID=UPI001F04D293|nr:MULTISPECIES: hypothetical protein [unclassified Streptomyces]MCH0563933.1 hypothetical protein [Streptomyces sp. MUM 2J]MCH0570700.1 hypothetical protein [Streptomyces sp. MUM 136J]